MMKKIRNRFVHIAVAILLVKCLLPVLPVSVIAGSLLALFPFLYKQLGKNSDTGNSLIIDEIHEQGGDMPAKMAPPVLITIIAPFLAARTGVSGATRRTIAGFLQKHSGLPAGIYRGSRNICCVQKNNGSGDRIFGY